MGKEFADNSGKGKLLVPEDDVQVVSGAYKFGGGSYYFDGADDSIRVSPSPDFDFGTNDFTIDFWFKRAATAATSQTLVNRWEATGDARSFAIRILGDSGHIIRARVTPDGTNASITDLDSTTAVNDTNWHHIAFVRSDSTLMLFLDGLLEASASYSSKVYNSDRDIQVGSASGEGYFNGYMDEVRIIKHKAVWTANFLPPAAKMDAIDDDTVLLIPGTASVNTILLLHCKGSDGSQSFDDFSILENSVTAHGNAQIDTNQSGPWGKQTGVALFDGTGDYLTVPDRTEFDFSTVDWTVDFWLKTAGGSIADLVNTGNGSATDNNAFEIQYRGGDSKQIRVWIGFGSSNAQILDGSTSVGDGSWHHVAVVRDGNNYYLFVDGDLDDSGTNSGTLANPSNDLHIGSRAGSNEFNGSMAEIRISRAARWTSTFNKPSEEYTITPADVSSVRHSVENTGVQLSQVQKRLRDKSLYFDGSSYLVFDDSAYWDLGSDDFTLDAWVYFSSLPSSSDRAHIFAIGDRNADDVTLFALFNDSGTYRIEVGRRTGSWTFFDSDAISISAGEWHHLAAVRSGNTMYYFFDGVAAGTDSVNINFDVADTSGLYVGARKNGSGIECELNGYLSEVRITKGTARWTSDFVPPIDYEPKPYNVLDLPRDVDDDTKLLLHFEGDNNDTNTNDYSKSDHSIAFNDGAKISTSHSKLGSSSLYLDGSGDYLTLSNASDWQFGSGDFTIEAWVRFDLGIHSDYEAILALWEGSGNQRSWILRRERNTGYIQLSVSYDGSATTEILTGTTATAQNTWYHVAVTRKGNNWYLYVDGVEEDNASSSSSLYDSSAALTVGIINPSSPTAYFNGYIDEARITKGLARWTANFDPADTNYPDAKEPATKLLLHMNKVDGNTYFKDSSGANHFVFPVGNAALSTAQKKFGARSLSLNGTDSYLKCPDSEDWYFGTGNFTIDFWVRFDTLADYGLVSWGVDGDNRWYVWYSSSANKLKFASFSDGSSDFDVEGTWNPSINTWYHIAVVRTSGNTFIFVDGTSIVSSTDTDPVSNHGGNLLVGAQLNSSSVITYFLDGFIDELRITKGIARWTNNFTVPAAPYRDYL